MIEGDALEVITGPEDGAVMTLLGGATDLGSGMDCGVRLQMDPHINYTHARLLGLQDGYKVRAMNRGLVQVNGARAGRVRGQILRAGDLLKVGETELYLHLSPQCDAERNQGASFEHSDAGYFLVLAATQVRNFAGQGVRVAVAIGRRVLRPRYLIPAAMIIVIYLLLNARTGTSQISRILQWGIYYARNIWSSMN